jgi:hypothetical protein
MIINNTYVRQGKIEPQKLFRLEDITEKVLALQGEVEEIAGQLGYVLARKDEPEIQIGSRCSVPFDCDYQDYCWKDVPEYSVYNVFSRHGNRLKI